MSNSRVRRMFQNMSVSVSPQLYVLRYIVMFFPAKNAVKLKSLLVPRSLVSQCYSSGRTQYLRCQIKHHII